MVMILRSLASVYLIMENNEKKSHLLLNLSAANNETVSVSISTVLPFGGEGTPGSLYSRNLNGATSYYILKSRNYGNTLWGNSLNDPFEWEFVGNDRNQAVQLVTDRILSERAKQPVIYHGQLNGNMDVAIPLLLGERKIVMDGSINLPTGNLSKEGGGEPYFLGASRHSCVCTWQYSCFHNTERLGGP